MQKFFDFSQFFKFQNFWSFLVKLCFLRGHYNFQKFSIFSKISKIWRKYIIFGNLKFLKKKFFQGKKYPSLTPFRIFMSIFPKKFRFWKIMCRIQISIFKCQIKILKIKLDFSRIGWWSLLYDSMRFQKLKILIKKMKS